MRSTFWFRASAISSVSAHVVQPPFGLSVSSIPTQIGPRPGGPVRRSR